MLRGVANWFLRAIVPESVARWGARIVLNPNDPVVSGAITLRVYERAETRFFLSVCRSGMTYLDIGANVGYYTAIAARQVGSKGVVIAIEPDPECYDYLSQTVSVNRFLNVHLVQKAASDTSGSMTLYRNLSNRGDNRLYPNELSSGQIKVETTTVDSLLSELHVTTVDFIKIDIQGFEGHALRGMKQTLSQESPLIMLSEFWPKGLLDANTNPGELLDSIRARGFELYELTKRGKLYAIRNHQLLVDRYTGRQYTNVVAVRGIDVSHL